MGAWGTAILSDDTAQDVYSDYMDRYDENVDVTEIRRRLEAENAEVIADPDDGPVFWLALAKAQWMCGVLDADILQRVTEIVLQDIGLERWAEEGPKLLKQRKQVLEKFLAEITVPRPKPRKRKTWSVKPAIFQPGDCLAIRLSDGEYGAALVLAIQEGYRGDTLNLLAPLRYKRKTKPAIGDFLRRNWMKLTHGAYREELATRWCAASRFKLVPADYFEVVGNIPIKKDDPITDMTGYGRWELGDEIMRQEQWERKEKRGFFSFGKSSW